MNNQTTALNPGGRRCMGKGRPPPTHPGTRSPPPPTGCLPPDAHPPAVPCRVAAPMHCWTRSRTRIHQNWISATSKFGAVPPHPSHAPPPGRASLPRRLCHRFYPLTPQGPASTARSRAGGTSALPASRASHGRRHRAQDFNRPWWEWKVLRVCACGDRGLVRQDGLPQCGVVRHEGVLM